MDNVFGLLGWNGQWIHIALVIVAVLIAGWLLLRYVSWPAGRVEIAIVGVAASMFAAVAEDVVTNDTLTRLDVQLTAWMVANRVASLTELLSIVSWVHETVPLTLASLCGGLWLVHRREWRWLTSLVSVVPIGMTLNVGLKHLFQRARPVFDEPLVTLTTYSFPSGHVTGSTLLYGFVCAFVFAHVESMFWRSVVGLAALSAVCAVAVSRIYLGAHYLSDVLGSFALAVAWLALCLSFIRGQFNALLFPQGTAASQGSDPAVRSNKAE